MGRWVKMLVVGTSRIPPPITLPLTPQRETAVKHAKAEIPAEWDCPETTSFLRSQAANRIEKASSNAME